jgi:dolichyl-phosphate-mannose--protein O-mannosyl transferase
MVRDLNKYYILFYISLLLITSYFIIFYDYSSPANLYWDENYYLTSSQKYINHVFFFEAHPPLGKMLIAAGEVLLHPNDNVNTSSFTSIDYIKDLPSGYSFKGVRFFPVLLASLCPILIFFILYLISNNSLLSFCCSLLYIFDNALVVHFRGAMLDSAQIFFILLSIIVFLIAFKRKEKVPLSDYLFLGIAIGLAASVKFNSVIMLLLPVFLFLKVNYSLILKIISSHKSALFRELALRLFSSVAIFSIGLLSIMLLVFYIHFSLSQNIVGNNDFDIPIDYKYAIQSSKVTQHYFFVMLKGYFNYIMDYHKGVPKRNDCLETENGSFPLNWLLGSKAINYRWEKEGSEVKYLYLVPNPILWFCCLIGLILSIVHLFAHMVYKLKIENKSHLFLSLLFLVMYTLYMIIMLRLDRVLYLYHYFIPLLFSFILFFLQLNYFKENTKREYIFYIILLVIITISVSLFLYLSPLTYYNPISESEFHKRALFTFWHMKPIILMAP